MTLIQKLTLEQLNDYKIVIVPHADLVNRIKTLRNEFEEKYKLENLILSQPDLTLVTYKQSHLSEQRIINHLKPIAMAMPSFKVEIKDFGSQPTHSIFLQVPTKIPVEKLRNTIRTEVGRFMKVDNDIKPHFLNDFNFVLGRKLKPWQYEQGWLEYTHRHFTAKFIADRMLLLKKKKGEFKYQILHAFEFQNLPIESPQGQLF